MASSAEFTPAGFFALRTPLLPFDELLDWGAGLTAAMAGADLVQVAAALTTDRVLLRTRLQELLTRPTIREAIFVASPDLDEGIQRWLRDPASEKGEKVERSLTRYLARMTGRATPFGIFAGCSVGTIGETTQLQLPARSHYARHTRLDMDYLFALADALGRDQTLGNALIYRPNTSLYHAAGRLRYAEARLAGKQRSYHLVAVEENDYVAATLARSAQGATAATLAAAIVAADPEIALEEAEQFIDELITSQLLVADLTLTVTGAEPIHDMLAQLQAYGAAVPAGVIDTLVQTRQALAQMDAAGLGAPAAAYRAIANDLAALPTKVELARLFQVDMVKPADAITLGHSVVDEIERGVDLLHRLFGLRQDGLSRFREAFVARYEEREAPLVEVLDEEIGIGFDRGNGEGADASPLLEGLAFPVAASESTTPWSARQTLLLHKLLEAQQSGATTIDITSADLEKLGERGALPLPNAFAVMANVVAASPIALTEGDFQVYVHSASGPSGARLLGRFCHGDPRLQTFVEEHLRAEEALAPEAIFAEIVHLPEGRIGNILCRPVLRGYEIPFLGRSSAAPEAQIPITDLMVSVRGGRIVLRSARLNRQIIPRLTSAHNYAWRGLGVYKFLCMLQGQGVTPGLNWDWGVLSSAPFLPRVTSGRLVLARAQWNATHVELKALSDATGAARFQALQQWRAQRRLPRFIVVADGDNELPVDLDNVLSIETFVDLVKNRPQATLLEFFPGPDQLCAHSPEGRFVHEVIVPFVRRQDDKVARWQGDKVNTDHVVTLSSLHPVTPSPRQFAPGSEWLYAKLYTGTATADQVLREVIGPVVRAAQANGALDQWFFLRYSDPDWHLRVRLHGDPQRLMSEVLPALHAAAAPLLAAGQLWRIQLDTYTREVERYGGPLGMALAERLFSADSEAVLAIVDRLAGDAGADARWRLTLRGIDLLLQDLGFDPATQHRVIRQVRDSFAAEFRADKHFTGKLAEKYRNDRKRLEALFDPAYESQSALAPGFALLHQRSAMLAPIVEQLRTGEATGQLTQSLTNLAASYIHMHANRLLRSAQRAQELVLYDFLDRTYESRTARARQSGKPVLTIHRHPAPSSAVLLPMAAEGI